MTNAVRGLPLHSWVPGIVSSTWRTIRRLPLLVIISAVIVLLFFFLAVVGRALAPYVYTAVNTADRFQPPSSKYLLGTDELGRDILSRILVGARDIVALAGIGTLLAVLAGTAVGLLSGYWGGMFDEVLMRLIDSFFSIPALLFTLLLVGMIGPSRMNIILVIVIRYGAVMIRMIRGVVLETKGLEYVEAAKMRGESAWYIVFREIMPAVMPVVVVEACMRFAYSIFLVASLGYLGLGLPPPTPDWGTMVVSSQQYITVAPWMTLAPATAVAVLVVAVNMLADGLGTVLRQRAAGEER